MREHAVRDRAARDARNTVQLREIPELVQAPDRAGVEQHRAVAAPGEAERDAGLELLRLVAVDRRAGGLDRTGRFCIRRQSYPAESGLWSSAFSNGVGCPLAPSVVKRSKKPENRARIPIVGQLLVTGRVLGLKNPAREQQKRRDPE